MKKIQKSMNGAKHHTNKIIKIQDDYKDVSYMTEGPMTFQTASGNLEPPSTYMYGFQPLTTTPTTQDRTTQKPKITKQTNHETYRLYKPHRTPSQDTRTEERSLAGMVYYLITRLLGKQLLD